MRAMSLAELLAWKPEHTNPIIDNDILIHQGTLGIYGSEDTWKSMLMLDLMFRIANGQPWFEFKTFQTSVMNFQSEIPVQPLQERAFKYANGNHLAGDNFWFCTELYEKIDKGWGYTQLEKEIARCMPRLLIIDPVYNSTSVNLVDDYQVGLFLDKLNLLRQTYKLAIILVHHNRQAEHGEGETYRYGTDEWFGSSRFKRWLDTMIYVERVSDGPYTTDIRLNFEKMRYAKTGRPKPVNIRVKHSDLTFKRVEVE